MGNSPTNSLLEAGDQIFKQCKQLRKQKNGVILSHLQTGETYFLREVNFINGKDYERELQRLGKQESKQENENIIKLVRHWGKEYNNFCSNSYKVYAVYECPEITLLDEVAARQKEERFFQECDLWSILQSCTNALADLKPTLTVEPSKVYIQADGLLKIAHNDMTDDQYRCIIDEKIYYAPEKITNFNRPDQVAGLQKEAAFGMGMTLLHAALLEDLHGCYDYKNLLFDEKKLEEAVERLNQRYSESFIEALATILEPNPNRRPSLIEVQDILNMKWSNQGDMTESIKCEHQTEDLKQSHTVNQDGEPIKNEYQTSDQAVRPLEEVKNQTYCAGLQNRVSFQPAINSNYSTYVPSYQSKENIFTDPKLLEMIKKDLQEINNFKQSHIFHETSNYGNDYSRSSLAPLQHNTSIVESKTNFQTYIQSQPESARQGADQNSSNHDSNRSRSNNSFNPSKRIEEAVEEQDEVLHSQPELKIVKLPLNRSGAVPIFTTQQYDDGRYFEGMMVNGAKQGKGKMVYEEGSYYDGNFISDMMSGKGTLYYGEGKAAYEGNWVEDQFHGKGILYNQAPMALKGQFDYSDFNCVEQFWVEYEGDFIFDNKSGVGTLLLSNGEVFNGHFEKDSINGRGSFTNLRGQTIAGVWENNILVEVLGEK